MLVSFNPSVSNNKPQSINFKALPINKIIKNDAESYMFAAVALRQGRYNGEIILKTPENIKDLFEAIKLAIQQKKLGVLADLEEVRDEIWKVTQ